MIDLKKLWDAMPRDVQRKISCHDLKRIVDNYNGTAALASESQREADVLRDEMAAHADYLERAQAGETSDDDCELYGHGEESESNWEAAGKADEKPDGQAENKLLSDP